MDRRLEITPVSLSGDLRRGGWIMTAQVSGDTDAVAAGTYLQYRGRRLAEGQLLLRGLSGEDLVELHAEGVRGLERGVPARRGGRRPCKSRTCVLQGTSST